MSEEEFDQFLRDFPCLSIQQARTLVDIRRIQRILFLTPEGVLEAENEAVAKEDYIEAARLRDMRRSIEGTTNN